MQDNETDSDQVKKIADLANINLMHEQEASLAKKFNSIRGYFDELSKVDISKTKEIEDPYLVSLREDSIQKSAVDLSSLPYLENKMFKTPKIIE